MNFEHEDGFSAIDDLSLDGLDDAVFQADDFLSPTALQGDGHADFSNLMPVPWLSWSDALLGNADSDVQNEVDDIDLVWKYLHDAEEVQLDGNRCFVATESVEQHVEDDACAQDEGASDYFTPEVETPVTDDVKLCGLKRALEEVPEDAEAESSDDARDSSPDEPLKKKKRGEHVKGRREMQETAREGQKHWATKVVELRDEWEKKNVGRLNKQYVWQLRMCERLRVKPQRECILLALQIAAVDGLIMPFPFIDSKHSLGWSGFQVKKDQSGEFRKRITDMFTNQCKGTTINNTFRRAGLVAEGNWERAWRGLSPFVYPHWQNAT